MSENQTQILVVEDEINLAKGLRFSLEHENYAVTLVHDGQKALELLRREGSRFHLIVLDIMLPGVNGYTICDQVRAQGLLTPIMFLSARTLPEDRARGFDVGANQYLAKPFELDEFLARIRNMLKLHQLQVASLAAERVGADTVAPGDGPENPLKIGAATVRFDVMEVERAGVVTHLTQLENALLRYFVLHPNRLISKDELLEQVWKMPGVLNTRAPDQFILRLRKIFEPDPANPVFFLTYRNAGYRFVSQEAES